MLTFTFSASYLDADATIGLTITCDAFELHVTLRVDEIARLDNVLSTPWEGGALHVGTCGGRAAWWSCDGGNVAVCVGHDDQTWDFGVEFPASEFPELTASIDSELAARSTA